MVNEDAGGTLRVGSKVRVPWGLELLDGVVEEIYGPEGRRHAVVSVPVPGSAGEDLGHVEVSYPLTALEPGAASAEEAPGFLDTLADTEDALPAIAETLNEIAALTQELGAQAEDYTERLRGSDAAGRGARGRLDVILQYKDALSPLATRMDELSQRFALAVQSAEPGLLFLLRVAEADPMQLDEAPDFLPELSIAGETGRTAIPSVEGFLASLRPLENVSRDLRPTVRTLQQAVLRDLAFMHRVVAWGDRARALTRRRA